MIDLTKIKEAAEYIKNNCKTDDFRFLIYSEETLNTRFAQNAITQHISGENISVQLSVAFGKKTGTSSINQIEKKYLDKLIEDATNIAELNEPDPEFLNTLGKDIVAQRSNFSQNTKDISTEEVIEIISLAVKNAKEKEGVLSGMSTKSLTTIFAMTKNGFEAYDNHSDYTFSMTLKKEGVETKVSQGVRDFKKFSIQELITKLNSQFDSLSNPQSMEAGKISVILRPAAVHNLFGYLAWMLNKRDADDGVSAFSNQEGKEFFGNKFNLESSFKDENISGSLFNTEGLIAKDIEWIKDGILKSLPTSRFWAKEKNIEPSFFSNFIISGGEATEKEMMKEAGRGLIINDFWYIRFVDFKKGELTGMTRDGVLYFEDGEVKHSVNNFRWNEVINEATKRIISLGKESMISSSSSIPTMLIKDFNFVDKTNF